MLSTLRSWKRRFISPHSQSPRHKQVNAVSSPENSLTGVHCYSEFLFGEDYNVSKGEPYQFPQLNSELDYENYLNNEKLAVINRLKEPVEGLEDLFEFQTIQQIGKGSFGKVMLVQNIKARKFYAMKILSKKFYSDRHLVRNVMREKRYLYAMNNPFIVSLNFHYKDDANLYLLMEFVNGGDLEYHLYQMKRFPECLAKFYATQIVLAFEYLHSLNLVYRDLKPNNIVIDRDGYIKIVDFGLVKEVLERTGTIVGTPEYFAPELVLNKRYNKSLDWWTLGILIYHMMCGVTPFYHTRQRTMYANIHRAELQFPRNFSATGKNIVNSFLQVDPRKRLGNKKDSTADVKAHPWFSDVDFISIFNKKVIAPWKPLIVNSSDIGCIPQVFEQNESIDECFTEENRRNESLVHKFDEF